MKIRFQPRTGITQVELRDITGGSPWGVWRAGDEREVGSNEKVLFGAPGGGNIRAVPVADAIFRHGPDFVDAATGKNPLYTCACGADALVEPMPDLTDRDMRLMPIVDANGKRQCFVCWLTDHPELLTAMQQRGIPRSTLARVRANIVARRARAADPKPAPTAAPSKE